jgi:hypothetical protein
LTYTIFVGITQIILYAIGLPVLVFVFLWRHRDELKKPVVKFRYGLFFAGFRKEKYYWECIVALRKESTVLLAVFGNVMGIDMLAHVALLVFMVQILVQLIGHPYEPRQIKLQVLDVTSIVICWGTMWSGFFFYSPRPPSQKKALEFLTVLVVTVNVLFMLVLLYSMCSETCREHENNRVVKVFRKRTSDMRKVLKRRGTGQSSGTTFVQRRGTKHFENPVLSCGHNRWLKLKWQAETRAVVVTTPHLDPMLKLKWQAETTRLNQKPLPCQRIVKPVVVKPKERTKQRTTQRTEQKTTQRTK